MTELSDFFLGQGGALAVAGACIVFLQRQVGSLQQRLAQLETEHRASMASTHAQVLEVAREMHQSLRRAEDAVVRLGARNRNGGGSA